MNLRCPPRATCRRHPVWSRPPPTSPTPRRHQVSSLPPFPGPAACMSLTTWTRLHPPRAGQAATPCGLLWGQGARPGSLDSGPTQPRGFRSGQEGEAAGSLKPTPASTAGPAQLPAGSVAPPRPGAARPLRAQVPPEPGRPSAGLRALCSRPARVRPQMLAVWSLPGRGPGRVHFSFGGWTQSRGLGLSRQRSARSPVFAGCQPAGQPSPRGAWRPEPGAPGAVQAAGASVQ